MGALVRKIDGRESVFKTGAFNRSATHPPLEYQSLRQARQENKP
jgi:hypothetical protein